MARRTQAERASDRERDWNTADWQKYGKCDNCATVTSVRKPGRSRRWLCWPCFTTATTK